MQVCHLFPAGTLTDTDPHGTRLLPSSHPRDDRYEFSYFLLTPMKLGLVEFK